jgi:hypothetical protein
MINVQIDAYKEMAQKTPQVINSLNHILSPQPLNLPNTPCKKDEHNSLNLIICKVYRKRQKVISYIVFGERRSLTKRYAYKLIESPA